jgi:hypothetical protein
VSDTTRRRAPLPPSLTTGAFTIDGAREAGASIRRLRGADLVAPIRGIRLPPGSDSLLDRCRAFALHRQHDFCFSHTTAAALYGAPLPRSIGTDIHVSIPGAGRAPAIPGFVGHKLSAWSTVDVDGLPVTTPEQTWLDLAPMLGQAALVSVGDFFVSGREPLTDPVRIARHVAASRGRRGVARARLAVGRIRQGVESAGETRLRLLLADSGLPEPALNLDLHDSAGAFVARVDLAYPDARLALEYEGDIHRTDRVVWQRDIARRERVEDLGWRMVRITAADLTSPADLVHRIRRLLRSR